MIKTIEQLLDEYAQSYDFKDYLAYQDALTLSDSEWREICIKYTDQFIDYAMELAHKENPIDPIVTYNELEEIKKLNK